MNPLFIYVYLISFISYFSYLPYICLYFSSLRLFYCIFKMIGDY